MDEGERAHREIFEPGFGPGAMGYLAPERYGDEALSGWLVRIAQAHYLTLKELLKLTGLCWYRLDEGEPEQVEALSTMLGASVDASRRSLRRSPDELPPSPAYSWVVCRCCLDGDIASNRTPYIRLAWTDPLATYCLEHDMPLVHQDTRDPFGEIFAEVTDMFDVSAYRYLRDLAAHDMEALRAFALDASQSATRSTARQIREVSDIAAALVLPVGQGYPYSVIDKLNTRYGRSAILPSRKDFEPDIAWTYWASGRLGLLRAALNLLERPGQLGREGVGVHGYGRWKTKRRRGIHAPGRSLEDPLLFLAMALSAEHRGIVTDRSAAWSAPTRTRWKDCLILADQLPLRRSKYVRRSAKPLALGL